MRGGGAVHRNVTAIKLSPGDLTALKDGETVALYNVYDGDLEVLVSMEDE